MDPLSALSIAASVIQFVQFTSNILKSAVKIYQSSEGVSSQSQHLSDVYTKLSQLASSLTKEASAASISAVPDPVRSCSSAIVQLGRDCQTDCDRLLGLVRKLQTGRTTGRWWKSFSIALKEHLKSEEISQLQKRIGNYEVAIMMHLCTLSSHHCMTLNRDICDLNSAWKTHIPSYEDDIKQIKTTLSSIDSRATEMHRQNRYAIDKMDVDLLTSKLAAVSIETGALRQHHEILESLEYEQRHERYEAIPLAHQETFQWAFHKRQDCCNVSNGYTQGEGDFSRWLQEGNDTFWISGKPGSGKSTLMKFLAGHGETQRMLDESPWADSGRVVIASHYFWFAGTPMQRSQQGLWRSLLYEILRKDPRIIPQVCTERYGSADADSRRQPWSLRELLDCIQALANRKGPGTKFCVFVDGLDEYEGDSYDLIKPLQALSKSRLVKLCAASRPWNAFEQAFGHRSDLKIYVQDLTRSDIRAFASDRLSSHPNWTISAFDQQSASLVEDITERSAGVFLWVFMVTRELREGLSNFDSLLDLKRRLHKMPVELGPFFKHILDSVDSFYHERAAETLQISLAAHTLQESSAADDVEEVSSLHFSIYYFHDKQCDNPEFAQRMPVEPKLESHTATHMRRRVHYRLNGICKGLLELNGSSVGYIHRTVKDWLAAPTMQKYLNEKCAPTFNPYGAILSACLARLKSTKFTAAILVETRFLAHTWHGTLNRHLREALSYVPHADSDGDLGVKTFQVIECLGNTVEELFKVDGARFSPFAEASAQNPTMMFRQHLLEARLWHYIAARLQAEPGFFDLYPATPFNAILKDNFLIRNSRMEWTQQQAEFVYGVLAEEHTVVSGCNDDCACAVRVIWTLMVRDCLPENTLAIHAMPSVENLVSFKSALESGIMSRLASRLRLSPKITSVAQTSLGSLTAWLGLILVVLKTEELSHKHKDEFLQVLESILGSPTTDFCSLTSNTDSNGTIWCDVLCRHLQYYTESINQSDAQDEFLASIVSILLVNAEKQWVAANQIDPPRRLLKSTISHCFSQKSAESLLSIIGRENDSATVGNIAKVKKREGPDEAAGGPLPKRAKRLYLVKG